MSKDLDLNELAKRPEYAATVSSVAEKDADAERHIKLVTFYVLLGLTVAALIICAAVFFGWVSATAEQQSWAQGVLQTLFPAAAAYALARQERGGKP